MTPEIITTWLSEDVPTLDEQSVRAVLEQYPYFLPARYMEAALLNKAGNKKYYDSAYDYAVNHVLFHQLTTPQIEKRTVTTEMPQEKPKEREEQIIQPLYTEDYFRQQGVVVNDELPTINSQLKEQKEEKKEPEDPRSLMVMMSFAEWLQHFKTTSQKEKEEEESRKALKTHWQKEKLAAALEEEDEDDEIPEDVFQMAVASISKEDGLVSESLAEILVKQRKWDKAIEMYRKLSLRNPEKSAYFAAQIESIQKESNS